ncbi:MAG: hypothetical protein ACFFGZ_15785 [Candidatus Thorarchaeota archaeon]
MSESKARFKVRLPVKSTAAAFGDIMQIVKRFSHWSEGRFLYVTFDEPERDLETLLSIAKSLSAFQFYIDNEEIKKAEITYLQRILFCEDAKRCNGVCTHGAVWNTTRYWKHKLPKVINVLRNEQSLEIEGHDVKGILAAGEKEQWIIFQETQTETKVLIDKEKLQANIREGLHRELQFCSLINWKAIEQQIDELAPVWGTWDKTEEAGEEAADGEALLVRLPDEQIELLAIKIAQALAELLKNKEDRR